MGLFDRFRAQPKWKQSDPAVRLSAIDEIALEDQATLASIAREDADPRVRRAAVRKLYDPAVLEEVTQRDGDAGVREEAAGVLLDLALGAFEDSSETESLKALDHLHEQRHLVQVAKEASAEAVSLAALSRLTDPKAVGSVARRAVHPSTRLEALGRVANAPDEIHATALKADHKDVALNAVERLSDVDQLRAVMAKSAHKAVARRAKAMLQAMEEARRAAAAAAAASAPPPPPDFRSERDRLCRAVEDLQAERDWRMIESRLAAATEQWNGLTGDSDEQRAARFDTAVGRARETSDRLKKEEAARAERVEQLTREQAARAAVCERVEALGATLSAGVETGESETAPVFDQAPAALAEARNAWAGLATPSLAPSELEAFERRFERASRTVERELERARTARANRARLQELVVEAEAAAAASPSGDSRVRWNALKQEWADLGGARVAGQALGERFETAHQAAARRDSEAREEEQRRQRDALQHALQVCVQVEAVAATETLTLKDGERALREAKAALDGLGALSKKDRVEVGDRLRAAQTSLFPRVHELREADDWARWANVGIQEDLCRRAEALREVADAGEAARQLRELQQQWKRASAVPRDKAQGLWERFKNAGDEVHARAEAHFAQETAQRTENLARKEALCQQAEALSESTEWVKTAEAIQELQVQWKAIGPVPRGHEKAVWERFRAACDRFFTRRREDLVKRKEEWAANQARKEALIAQVEALAETGEWSRAVDEVKRLQAEWKAVGPVRRTRSEELWQRFRGACDRFFERYQQRDQIQVAANVAAREDVCRELEALLPPASADGELALVPEAPAGLRDTVQALRTRWQHAPTLMPRDTMATLTTRYNDALAAVSRTFPDVFQGSDLDLAAIRRKAEALCERVEQVLPREPEDAPTDESPAAILAARLREALAANTIGGVAVADQDARWRGAAAAVKEAQSAWAALSPLPREVAQALGTRFEQACLRFFEAEKRRR
ncbi:MAG: DUF349 domain-containing protein [Bacteroidales bacterium]